MKTHHITIYGPGCMRCNTLAENTKQAIAAMSADIELHKETDPMKIAADGVLNTPALALDGKVLLSGKVPSAEDVRELLSKALDAETCCCGESNECCCAEPTSKPQDSRCCCGGGSTPAKETGCECNGGSCCGGSKGGSGLKTLLVILVLGLLAFAVIRHLEKSTAPEPSSDSPAAAQPVNDGVVLDYFTFGQRCVTCVRMETWAREAVEAEFADDIKNGRLALRTQEGDPATLRKYGLTAKSLVLRNVADGKESSWRNLDRIWELNGDEAAYKAYIIENVRQAL